MRFLLFLSLLMTIGCETKSDKGMGLIRVHSELVFEQSGHTRHFDISDNLRTSKEQLNFFSQSVGMSNAEITSELSDPFLTHSLEFILFTTIEPAQKIASFYENEFLFEGWVEKRGILLLEMTHGGGDWLKVYKKGNSQVLCQIVGPWKDNFEELERGSFVSRTVLFKFFHCTGNEIFGSNNLEKIKILSLHGMKKPKIKSDDLESTEFSRFSSQVVFLTLGTD